MLNVHHIIAVAIVEAKLLLRTITFKSLWGVYFLVTLFFVVFSHLGGNFKPSVPGALATKCFFFFSLIRMLISSFLAPVFVWEDRKYDFFQTLSPRPFTNTDYTFGKLIGFTSVMLVMDYCFMLILFVSSLLLPHVVTSIWPYLLYPIIITLPLCVFLFGCNVFAARIFYSLVYLIPLAMVMLFLPLEDLESTRFLDLGGITLPLAYSAITGFYDMSVVIFQRLIYVSAGLGFVWGSCLLMQFPRRSGTRKKHIITSALIIVLLLFTALFVRIDKIAVLDSKTIRKFVLHYRKDFTPLTINSCDLTVIHEGAAIDVKARLKITNPNDSPLERLEFKHHMIFKTYNVISGNRIKSFVNHVDAIGIRLHTPLESNESMELEISDYGSILPASAYFHIPLNILERVHRSGLTALGKQTAFIEHDYVLLPAEIDWYPTSYSKYQPTEPGYVQRNLTEFSLEVTTHDGLTVISQGEMIDKGDNTYYFKPEMPLTQMSLTIGRYQKASINVDDIEYSYYWVENNPFSDTKITNKELEQSIRIAKEEIENKLQLKYPFKRYQIVETPIHFFGYNSAFDLSSPYDQPEIKFIPESSLDLNISSLGGRRQNGVFTLTKAVFPKLYETNTNSHAISSKMNPPSSIINLGGLWPFTTDPFVDYSNIITQYAVFSRGPVSNDDYFNLIAVNWLRSQFFFDSGMGGAGPDLNYRSLKNASSQFLETKSLKDILADEQYYGESMDILNMASNTFFDLLAAKSGIDLSKFENTLFHGFTMNDVDIVSELTELCGTDILTILDEFSQQKEKAHYELTDRRVAKHFIDDRYLYNVHFKVSNPTSYHGLVECSISTESNERDTKVVYLEPFTQKEMGLVLPKEITSLFYSWLPFGDKDRRRYFPSNSYNMPVTIQSIDSDQLEFFDGIRDVQRGTVPVAVVMDNLDEGCRIITSKEKKFIQRFIEKRKENASYKKFINFKGLEDAPSEWTLAKSRAEQQGLNEFYGKFSSCYYTKAGDGESAIEYVVTIPEAGSYQVYLSVPTGQALRIYINHLFESGALGETTVRIFADDGIQEKTIDISKADGEWVSVGTYTFSDTIAVIQITDKTNAEIVIADAIKLRKVE